MQNNPKIVQEMCKLIEEFDKFGCNHYFKGLVQEYGLIDDKDPIEALDNYITGAEELKDFACAAKLLLYHMEPSDLNDESPDADVASGVRRVIDVFIHKGIFDVYTPTIKKMDLLYFFYIQLDLNPNLRDYIIKM